MTVQVTTRFKPPRQPKRKEPSAASKRPGMDPAYLAAIRRMPSCVSGKKPCQAHHLRCAGGRGVSMKAEDKNALPLTEGEHLFDSDAVHRVGSTKEFQWFMDRGINPLELANALWNAWQSSKHSDETLLKVLEAHKA